MKKTGKVAAKPLEATRAQLSEALGVRFDRISEYIAAGMPCLDPGEFGGRHQTRRGRFDVIQCVKWWRVHRGGAADAQRERAALDAARRKEVELRLAEKEGKLVRAADVEERWSRLVVAARNELLGLPSRAKQRIPQLATSDVLALDALVRAALDNLADGQGKS